MNEEGGALNERIEFLQRLIDTLQMNLTTQADIIRALVKTGESAALLARLREELQREAGWQEDSAAIIDNFKKRIGRPTTPAELEGRAAFNAERHAQHLQEAKRVLDEEIFSKVFPPSAE